MFQKFGITNSILKTVAVTILVGASYEGNAKEGMWLPPTLKKKEADMKAMGLEIPIEKIYNADGTGLNNAVVLFGKGCTGEIISGNGLLLTNHHCGYGTVQGISSREKDYFANGFWAMNTQEELPCPGLTVTFIRKMENVTDLILPGIADTLPDDQRNKIIEGKIKALEKGYRYTTKLDASIKPYFNNNQYWVIISETFKDIRLVGFPPNGIGQFGGDTDNWMFPRHTGDFSMFRVYAGANNKPADYAATNKPYQTKDFFTINIGGYKENDFTMVYGFPGTTKQYISSYQLKQIDQITDPISVSLRTIKLESWTKDMTASREVFLKYTSKRAGVANAWKKWQGEMRGLKINKVFDKKTNYENGYQQWAISDQTYTYDDNILSNILANTTKADAALKAETYINEAVMGIELIAQASVLDKMIKLLETSLPDKQKLDSIKKFSGALQAFYKNYDANTDKNLFTALMPAYMKAMGVAAPDYYKKELAAYGQDYATWAQDIYAQSMVADKDKMTAFLNNISIADAATIKMDPAWKLYNAIIDYRVKNVFPILATFNKNMNYYNRLYMKSQMTAHNNDIYPDANLTLRVAYGNVKGIDPDGPATYAFQTNLDEAIAKDNPTVEEFKIPQKLKDLHQAKDYGRWAIKDSAYGTTVPLAFIADNHTTGGNSGSPVLNKKGQLIGTNFDRIWEGTMSDLYFDPNLCRNISLDIRYTLFIIEKFGGAGWLLKEMNLATQ